MTVQLSQEDVTFIENELSFVDKVSLIFLLYGQRNPQYALQILNVSGRMLSEETSFLVDWTNYKRSTSWEDELLEALTILEQNLLLLRAGFDDDELRSKYFPQTAEIALHVHPILKGLYQFCERLDDKTSMQLMKQLKQYVGNASVPQDCLEIVLLHLISNDTINLGSRASGKECDLVALTAACKSVELYDESEFLKGISQHYNNAVKAEQQVQSDASSKSYQSAVQQPIDVVEALNKKVVTITKTPTLECYDFDPQRAGIMLLVNQFRFYRETNPELVDMVPSKALKDRKGTEVDKNALVQLFTDLGYEMILEENITHHQIVQAVQHAVQRIRPAHCSLVVCLLSHGQEGIVYGSNSVPVEVKAIQHLMASERLTGKPKILIVQACQGSDLQSAVPVPTYEHDGLDSDDRTASVFMDFLVAWSTVPGFASIRHVEKGSWFIQELCTKLRQLYKSEQIMDILTSVINDVSSKRGYGNECMNAMENPLCTSTTATNSTVSVLLWTTIAVFGIVYTLLGYRCLRAIGFLTGLAAGAGCIVLLQNKNITSFGNLAAPALAVVAGLFGAVLGSTHPISSTLIGTAAGALVAGATIAACIATLPHYTFGENELLVSVVGGAIICAIVTLFCPKFMSIVASSIIGSAMILCSIDFFMHGLNTMDWIFNMKPDPTPPPCWGGVILCCWPIASVLGVLVQCFVTAWKIDHRRQLHHRRRRHYKGRSGSRSRETREEARQRKYRYLYQVRTARGDIISQNFVSALQKHVTTDSGPPSEVSTKTGSNDRNTARSDRTHLTNLADSDFDKMDSSCEKR
ncbi:hypothetical protein ZHAS_00015525 [Anopheles sinensis]|uniref:Transmembrane protein 198 n=1 Tax=Anopheles sinensis TaxID=74873 RepID=A0A084WBG7_ANOSI|nr:hypothetical protein ZHAS_00015525 [Anopheles sinensis]